MKKIFGIGVVAALVFFALQFKVGERPLKDYLIDFYHAPLVQEAIRQAKGSVQSYLQKDVGEGRKDGPPMENLKEDEVRELDHILTKESQAR